MLCGAGPLARTVCTCEVLRIKLRLSGSRANALDH